jgi:hypothetical protein
MRDKMTRGSTRKTSWKLATGNRPCRDGRTGEQRGDSGANAIRCSAQPSSNSGFSKGKSLVAGRGAENNLESRTGGIRDGSEGRQQRRDETR